VWVLATQESHIRIKGSKTAAAYMYSEHLQYLKGLKDWAKTPHIGTDTVAETVTQRARHPGEKRSADLDLPFPPPPGQLQ
jgi:hypothetical protein